MKIGTSAGAMRVHWRTDAARHDKACARDAHSSRIEIEPSANIGSADGTLLDFVDLRFAESADEVRQRDEADRP